MLITDFLVILRRNRKLPPHSKSEALGTFTISQVRTQKATNTASSEPTKENNYTQATDQSVMEEVMFLLSSSQLLIQFCIGKEK